MRGKGEEMGNCCAVRINSGRFGVEWQKTKAVLEAGDLDITVFRPEAEEKVGGTDTSAERKLGRPPVKGEKSPGLINARVDRPSASVRAKAQSPFDKQVRGAKRKVEEDVDGDSDDNREDRKRKQPAQLHPGIGKRRKKLGLDG